jgi:uncharacterized protein YeaO (DUF488 family)
MPEVRARRVYEEPQASDGKRVLVDRLWPRGLAKDAAHLDEWLKAVAPSDELRHWYGHDPAKFAEFRRRYGDELRDQERATALQHLRELAVTGTLTLLTATKDLEHSQAADLADRLREASREAAAAASERGGDPACWLHRVCPRCGEMAESDPPTTCPRCHTEIPAA